MQRVSKQVRNELVEALRERYKVAGKTEKSRILKEFSAVRVRFASPAGKHLQKSGRKKGRMNLQAWQFLSDLFR